RRYLARCLLLGAASPSKPPRQPQSNVQSQPPLRPKTYALSSYSTWPFSFESSSA
ncbi:MAG: hypothetical protein L6R39_002658, partial [Caloplaca ligustica]